MIVRISSSRRKTAKWGELKTTYISLNRFATVDVRKLMSQAIGWVRTKASRETILARLSAFFPRAIKWAFLLGPAFLYIIGCTMVAMICGNRLRLFFANPTRGFDVDLTDLWSCVMLSDFEVLYCTKVIWKSYFRLFRGFVDK